MSVAVLKQQSTLADYGFRNLYDTPTRLSPAQQARNVEQYMQRRRKENAGIEDIAAPAKDIARHKVLYDSEDLDEHDTAAEIIRDEIARSGLESQFPDYLDESINHYNLPALRDYYSRQSTLPEYMWDLTTEGEHFDKEGNILPGAIPPVNAVKVVDYNPDMSKIEGYGLVPNIGSKGNRVYEKNMARHGSPVFPLNQGVGFVAPPYGMDIDSTVAANVIGGSEQQAFDALDSNAATKLVGIRGFGVPQDKAFARPASREGREGIYTNPIPPERLVGVFRDEKTDYEDFPEFEAGATDYGQVKDKLPGAWSKGRFGFDNPALTREEKQRIATDILDRLRPSHQRDANITRTLYPAETFGFGGEGND